MNATSINMTEFIRIGGHETVKPDDIAYLEACGNYTYVQFMTPERKLFVATTIGIIEKRLESRGFVRLNRKYVVNEKFIAVIGTREVMLKDKTQLAVPRRRRKELVAAMVPSSIK